MAGLVSTILHEGKILGVMTMMQLFYWGLIEFVGMNNLSTASLTIFLVTICLSMFTASYMDEIEFGLAATALDYLICFLTDVVFSTVSYYTTDYLLRRAIKTKAKSWWRWGQDNEVKFSRSHITVGTTGGYIEFVVALCCFWLLCHGVMRSLVNSVSCSYKSFTFAVKKILATAEGDSDAQ